MPRLANLDITEIAKPFPPLATQILFGVGCAGAAVLLRALVNLYLPGAGPFATTVPVVLVATLFGRWLSGVICQTIAGLHAWYFVLPFVGSFEFEAASDAPRVLVNLSSGYVSVALAEVFRRTARNALRDREMLLVELEHRVKNSFASIAAVIRLQLRDAGPEAREVLQTALGRVESFARAYGYLRFQFDRSGTVSVGAYLQDLCEALATTATHDGRVAFDCKADNSKVPRDKAVTIGLLLNEIATNSVKHAFHGRDGVVRVSFQTLDNKQILVVSDDGPGMDTKDGFSGLGRRLIDALAQQAGGTVELASGDTGTSYTVTFTGA